LRIGQQARGRSFQGIVLIAGAVLYRPLLFWAKNAWDLNDPLSIFATTLFILAAAIAIYLVVIRFDVRELPVAFFIAGVVFIAFNYEDIAVVPPAVLLTFVVAASILLHRRVPDQVLAQIVLVALVVTVVAPAAQIAWQHVSQRISYPLTNLAPPVAAEPTGEVEDILLIIVDSYPMLAVANDWFGHDTSVLEQVLRSAGFEVPDVSWSHNTYTGLALPSILQVDQIADESPKGEWGNRRERYEIIGGKNFVVGTLRNAGFQYTHVEGGWNGASCIEVDVCLDSTWLNEANWNLLSSSLANDFLVSELGSIAVGNTLRVVDHLRGLNVFGDGHYDFVFAHMMLPHQPFVVDAECHVLPLNRRTDPIDEYRPLRQQLACVDSLLMDVVTRLDSNTAVLIAGDHGMRTRDQVAAPSAKWNDADIAERLGALLAYRLPEGCQEPEIASNLHAMRAIMACSVTAQIPSNAAGFLIGEFDPISVEPGRLSSIEDELRSGWTLPEG
jgi:hypothetical protein